MSVRRQRQRDPVTGTLREFYMVDIDLLRPDGTRVRKRKVSPIQTRRGAEQYERELRQAILDGTFGREEVPTFAEWHEGRYWKEWVIGRKNKPSTMEGKRASYKNHLQKAFGHLRLNQIGVGEIARFRANLIERKLGDKSINNVLADLSKPLHYAADVELIPKAPKIGLLKVEQPEIVYWEFDEYARILVSAKKLGPMEYAATCLAGEGGLRVGEIKGLRWREDVDLTARTMTVNQQIHRGIIGTPKGRTRRTVPMTETLYQALRALEEVREGFVIRNLAGFAKHNDNQVKNLAYRVCRLAGLPERGWHTLRHTFATHTALFGGNPWKLQTWMGHKRIDETMRYVHTAEAHARDVPPEVLAAAGTEYEPTKRVLKMLGGRQAVPVRPTDGKTEEAHRKPVSLSVVTCGVDGT